MIAHDAIAERSARIGLVTRTKLLWRKRRKNHRRSGVPGSVQLSIQSLARFRRAHLTSRKDDWGLRGARRKHLAGRTHSPTRLLRQPSDYQAIRSTSETLRPTTALACPIRSATIHPSQDGKAEQSQIITSP